MFGAGGCRRLVQSRGVHVDKLESGQVLFPEQEGEGGRSRVEE
jgi:hypothetical protein